MRIFLVSVLLRGLVVPVVVCRLVLMVIVMVRGRVMLAGFQLIVLPILFALPVRVFRRVIVARARFIVPASIVIRIITGVMAVEAVLM